MSSNIDPTKPISGSPTTQSVRDNFSAAATEITALQDRATLLEAGTTPSITPDETVAATSGALTLLQIVNMFTNRLKAIAGGSHWYSAVGTSLASAATSAAAAVASIAAHIADTANPHAVTKAQVGLSSVTNNAQLVAADIGSTVQAYDANTAKLNVAQTWTKAQRGAYVALTSTGSHIATDASLSNNFKHTMTENTTLDAPTNVIAGQAGVIEVTQHASAAKTLAYASFWKKAGGSDLTISATTSSVNVLAYVIDSSGTFATCTLQPAVA